MDNTQVKPKRDKKFKKQESISDQEAIKIFNKVFTKNQYSKYRLIMNELKVVGNWIKETLVVRDISESEIKQKMDEMIIPRFNTEELMKLCRENKVDEVAEKLNDPSFVFIPDYVESNKLSFNSLLFTGGKNHSKEILKLIFSKTNLNISFKDHHCLKNCGINDFELGIISQFYNYEDFSVALKSVARLKREAYSPEVVETLLKKQYIFINL